MSGSKPDPKPALLLKQMSWSPDTVRESVWLRRKQRRSKSLTDEDIDELKACIELGFGFGVDSESDKRLTDILPALGFYVAVNKSYNESISRFSSSSSLDTTTSSCSENDSGSANSPLNSPTTMFSLGDDPKTIKTRLRQWAQVVACSLRQT